MSTFGPALAIKLAIAVVAALIATEIAPTGRRTLTFGAAIALAGALTLALGYGTLKLAFDERGSAAGLAMLLVGVGVAISDWRARAIAR